jgi:hypothetical protein
MCLAKVAHPIRPSLTITAYRKVMSDRSGISVCFTSSAEEARILISMEEGPFVPISISKRLKVAPITPLPQRTMSGLAHHNLKVVYLTAAVSLFDNVTQTNKCVWSVSIPLTVIICSQSRWRYRKSSLSSVHKLFLLLPKAMSRPCRYNSQTFCSFPPGECHDIKKPA